MLQNIVHHIFRTCRFLALQGTKHLQIFEFVAKLGEKSKGFTLFVGSKLQKITVERWIDHGYFMFV